MKRSIFNTKDLGYDLCMIVYLFLFAGSLSVLIYLIWHDIKDAKSVTAGETIGAVQDYKLSVFRDNENGNVCYVLNGNLSCVSMNKLEIKK